MSFESLLLEDLGAPVKNAIVGGPFGSNLVSKDYVDVGVPVIRGQNMGKKWVGGEFVFVSNEKAEQLSQNKARPGDLVFTQRGTLGQVAIIPAKPFAEYIVSQSQMKVTLNPEKADVGFMYYLFGSEEQLRHIRNSSIQTGVPHTNLGILRKTPVKIPPLKIQQEIASILGSLDDRIALLRETNTTLEAIAQALFKSWFVDFDPVRAKQEGREPEGMDAYTAALFPNSFEESELGLVPKGWVVKSLAELMDIAGGTQPPANEFIDLPRDGYIRLIQIRDYETDSHITYIPDTHKLRKATKTDIMIARYGASVGRICWGLEGAYNVALVKVVCEENSREYLRTYLKSDVFQSRLDAVSGRSAQAGFNKGDIASFKFVVPPDYNLALYQDIVWTLRSSVVARLDRIRAIATLRDTLLPRLISGQLRLPDAETLIEETAA